MFDNIRDFFKDEKCSICNEIYSIRKLILKDNQYICYNCRNTFNKLNNRYDDKLFNDTSLVKIEESIAKKESIHSIEFNKKLEQHKIAEMQRKEKNNEVFEYNLQHLKFLAPEVLDYKVPKKLLKDMPIINFKNITKKTPFSTIDNFIVIDTETTGLRPSVDELLEISAIKFINFEPSECLTTLVRPKKAISNKTNNINHISNEMVKNCPEVGFIIQSFSNFIEDFNIVGYNLKFDISFLYRNGMDFFNQKRYFFDVLPICKKHFGNLNISNYKLDTICNYLGIRRNNAHRSTEDALATGILFRDIAYSIKHEIL